MLEKKSYLNMKKELKYVTKKNYKEILGLLQKYYMINAIHEALIDYDNLTSEVNSITNNYLKKLYNTRKFKKYFDNIITIDDDNKFIVTNILINNVFFPEFIDNSFVFENLDKETKESIKILFSKTDDYKDSSSKFKKAFNDLINREKDKSNYSEVKFPEYKKLFKNGIVLKLN